MNISSLDKTVTEPARDLKELLKRLEDLKTKIKLFEGGSDKDSYKELMINLNRLEEAIQGHLNRYLNMTRTLETATSIRLTDKQRLILQWLKEKYSDPDIYTKLIERISMDLEIAKSTVRWNLRGLREADLIEAGSKDNKGIPVSLTSTGKIMADYVIEVP